MPWTLERMEIQQMDASQQQLHQALAILAKYEAALNSILLAQTAQEAHLIAAKVLQE